MAASVTRLIGTPPQAHLMTRLCRATGWT